MSKSESGHAEYIHQLINRGSDSEGHYLQTEPLQYSHVKAHLTALHPARQSILWHCTLHDTVCRVMYEHIEHIYAQHNTPYMERELFLSTLLRPKHSSTYMK